MCSSAAGPLSTAGAGYGLLREASLRRHGRALMALSVVLMVAFFLAPFRGEAPLFQSHMWDGSAVPLAENNPQEEAMQSGAFVHWGGDTDVLRVSEPGEAQPFLASGNVACPDIPDARWRRHYARLLRLLEARLGLA